MALDQTYNVAIKLAAENAVSGVLAVISKDVLGLHGSVKDLEKGFSAWAPAIAGAAAAIAGIKLGEMVAGVVEAGDKLAHFQAQMLAATGDLGKVAAATSTAWQETTRNLNTSVADNVKNIQHLTAVTGSFEEAQKFLHPFTLADTALMSIKDTGLRGQLSGGEGQENNTLNLARALEQLGVTQNEEKLNSYLTGMTRAMISMRGQVDGTKFFQTINNAGSSRYGWNEEFVEQSLGPLIQATQGRIGNQLYQLDRTFGQGIASSRPQAENLEKYGLYSESDEVWEGGRFKGFKANTGFEPEVRRANPAQWAQDVREMMRGRGVDVDNGDAMNGVIAEMGRGNKNLGAALSELLLPQTFQALTKEQTNQRNVPQDAVQILQQKDPTLALQAFNTQWENLLTALGGPLVQTATGALQTMTGVLNSMATEVAAHPDIAKGVGIGLTGLAAALTAVGTVLVGGAIVGAAGAAGVSAGLLGAIAGFTAAVGAGLTVWAGYKDQITSFFNAIGSAFSGFTDKMKAFDSWLTGSPAANTAGQRTQQSSPAPSSAAGQTPNRPPDTSPLTDPQLSPGFSLNAWHPWQANDNLSPTAMAVRDGFLAAFQQIQGGAAGNGFDAGLTGIGGFTQAAYTTFGDEGAGAGGGSAPSIRYGRQHSYGPGLSTSGAGPGGSLPRGSGVSGSGASVPGHIAGNLVMGGESFRFGSGGVRGSASIPLGDYPITPNTIGSWGQANGAIGLNNNRIWDSALGRYRTGIEMHAAHSVNQITEGCLGIAKEQFPRFKEQVLKMVRAYGHAYLHIGRDGARITPDRQGTSLPTVGAPSPSAKAEEHHHHIHLGGKEITAFVTTGQKRMAMFPTSVGGMDTYGSYASPGTPLNDAA